MTRSGDGGIWRQNTRKEGANREISRDAIGCNEPRSLALRGGWGRGKEKISD
jgi:hypothetical protein